MKQRRRTKKLYTELHDNPVGLFANVKTILFPNGEPEIWLQTADGLGMSIKASNGPHGLGLIVRSHVGTPTLSTFDTDDREIEITQHRQNDKSMAFKRWYRHQETSADVALLGPQYQRIGPEV